MSSDPSGGSRGPAAVRPSPPFVASQGEASIAENSRFRALVRERSTFAWTLSAVMLIAYLAFIGLVAFAHDVMAIKVAGSEISLGILLGLAVIVFAFVLTGVYVVRANTRFDRLTRELREELGS